jgi:DNA-binding NarL/FixJ family response regulator
MENNRKGIAAADMTTGPRDERLMPFQTLIVEDSANYRHLLHEALSARFPAMDVQEAENGADAAAHIRDHEPDLIFMDVNLPGENGLELTRSIKASHPRIAIIVLTNYDLPEYREMAARCQANFFLSKSSTTRDSWCRPATASRPPHPERPPRA